MVIIPTFQDKASHFRQDIIVDGVALSLRLDFNSRSDYWQMSITDDIYSLYNKKIVANWPILRQSRALFPSLLGDFVLQKSDLDVAADVDFNNLNNGWSFLYLDRLELAEWEAFYGTR